MYTILPYTFRKAKIHGVVVRPSIKRNKKIDVLKNKKLIASVGALGYDDYPSWILKRGLKFANDRRRLYRLRHAKDLKSGAGYWANVLLW